MEISSQEYNDIFISMFLFVFICVFEQGIHIGVWLWPVGRWRMSMCGEEDDLMTRFCREMNVNDISIGRIVLFIYENSVGIVLILLVGYFGSECSTASSIVAAMKNVGNQHHGFRTAITWLYI